jgi:hypothetical protein
LDDEVELVERPLDSVVVDGDAQMLAAPGLTRLDTQHLPPGGNIERRTRRPIGHANDGGDLAAVPEEVLHGQRDEAERDMAAEDAAEFLESFDDDGLVQRPALGAADERYDRRQNDRNDFCTGVWVR